jgi:gliding motility-associated protein GldL
MGMSDLTHSKRWKTTMGYFYGIGASIVLLGALFKLQHWPAGGLMLTIGMSCETLIFFLSSFEPPIETPDWSKVYPQLKEGFEMDEEEYYPAKRVASSGFDGLLEKADISPELLAKVKKGLQDLSNTASGIADISSAALATDVYVKNLNSASESMCSLTEVNTNAAHSLEKSTNELVNNYDQASKLLSNSSKSISQVFTDSAKKINDQFTVSGDKLASSYKELSDALHKDFAALNDNSKSYSHELNRINGSLSALNSSYELHLQNARKMTEESTKAFDEFHKMNGLVNTALEEAKKYHKHSEQLNKNLEALNHIYGNMLGAMNIKNN